MATIGSFTKNDKGFAGEIRTLGLKAKATLQSIAKDGDKAPDFRVLAGNVEIGAGWVRKAKDEGREYISVKLDDPTFPAPIYVNLVEIDGKHQLLWSR